MIRVRLGRAEDFAAISQVELSAGTMFEGTHMEWAVGETTSASDLREALDSATLWVAESDEKLAGFLLGELFGRDFHLWELAVTRDLQGVGIGRLLVETALAAAAGRGCTRATLTTDRTLAWNAPWYARLGFVVVEPNELPERMVRILAGEPNPHMRCAMVRNLA